MRVFARPLRADGTEYMGTEGVISGDYQTLATFNRYSFRHHGLAGFTYNVYRVTDGRWTLLATWDGTAPDEYGIGRALTHKDPARRAALR